MRTLLCMILSSALSFNSFATEWVESEWVARNSWETHSNGTSIEHNEFLAGAFTLHYRAWGKTDVFLISKEKYHFQAGEVKEIAFNWTQDANYLPSDVSIGLASAYTEHGADLIGTTAPAKPVTVFSSTSAWYEGGIVTTQARDAHLVVHLQWQDKSNIATSFTFSRMKIDTLTDEIALVGPNYFVEQGQAANTTVRYSSGVEREIRIDLIGGSTWLGGSQVTVPAGYEQAITLTIPIEYSSPEKIDWYAKVLPVGGQWFEKIVEDKRPASFSAAGTVNSPLFFDSLFSSDLHWFDSTFAMTTTFTSNPVRFVVAVDDSLVIDNTPYYAISASRNPLKYGWENKYVLNVVTGEIIETYIDFTETVTVHAHPQAGGDILDYYKALTALRSIVATKIQGYQDLNTGEWIETSPELNDTLSFLDKVLDTL